MVTSQFNEIIDSQLDLCRHLLITKGQEYTPDEADRLAHFKKAATITGGTPKAALFGMFSKHLISIADMCTDGKKYESARWDEKITDSINYLLLLKALVKEEDNDKIRTGNNY